MTSEQAPTTSRGRRRRQSPLVVMGFLGGLVALAVWGKLRFVSDVPRMAYADPKQPAAETDTPEPVNGDLGSDGLDGFDRRTP